MARSLLRVGAILAAALGVRPAAGQVESVPFREARESFEAAARAEQRNDWVEACARYRKSVEHLPRPANTWKVGTCHRREGHFVLAWKALQRAKELNRADSSYKPDFEQVLNSELALLPTLRIDLVTITEDLQVTLDDAVVDPELIGREQPVELGLHRVTASAPGYELAQLRVEVERPQPYVVTIPLQRALLPVSPHPQPPQATPPSPSARPAPRVPEPQDSPRRTWGWALGGVGVAGLAASGVLGIVTLRLVSYSSPHCAYPDGSCDPEGVELRERASAFQSAGFVVAASSLLTLGGGIYLFATARSQRPSPSQRTSLAIKNGQLVGKVSW